MSVVEESMKEASLLHQVYYENNSPSTQIKWIEQINKEGVVVYSSPVNASDWHAVLGT
jgi:hypothetical protein